MNLKKPFLITTIALNLLAVVLYLWALQDHTTVQVRAHGDTLTATINDNSITATDPTYPTGKVALLLEDHRSYRAYVSSATHRMRVRQWLWEFSDWVLQSNLLSAWERITVTDLDSDEVLLHSDFGREAATEWEDEKGLWQVNILGEYRPSTPGITSSGSLTWQDYVVDADLARGKERAGILMRAQNARSAYIFWFRPEHGDMGWDLLSETQAHETLATGIFNPTLLSGVKALLREILWSYFFGLAILVIILLLSLPLAHLLGKLSLPLPRPLGGDLTPMAIIIAALGTATAAVACTVLLSRMPHVQDSVTYLFQAKTLALGRLSVPAPPLPEFFQHEFLVVQDGKWFGKYPPGYPAILALGVLLKTPWLVSPIMGGLSLFLIYLIGRNIYSTRIGLLASVLGLLSPFFIFMSASFMAHPTSMFFICLFVLSLVLMVQTGGKRWALVAGFAIAFVATTRQLTALSVSFPFALYFLMLVVRDFRGYGNRLGIFLLGAALPLASLLLYNWSLTGDPFVDTYRLYWDFDKIGFGEYYGVYGEHTPERGLMNTWANLVTLQVHLFGWPAYFTLALLFLPFATLRASRWDWLLLASCFCLAGAYIFYWADGIMYGPRYYYELLPILLLLTARSISLIPSLARSLWKMTARQVEVGAGSLVVLLMLVLVGYNLIYYMPIQIGIYKDYNFVSPKALQSVKWAGMKNALVFVTQDPHWDWWEYGSVFSANSPLLDTDVVFARDLGDEANKDLMLLFPGHQYYRLQEMKLSQLQPPMG
ncbi:MAG: glycosyltransferase family 39 protein [Chloroflexota bacterium]